MKDDTLKRTMKLHHLVIFGVAFLTPMIAYTIYGVIATSSHGVESGSICLTIIAMLFTALSYGHMAKAYPAAGSAYTYTRKAINSKLGVIAGWIVLLGYVFFPMAIWLIGASYFSAAVPAVPEWVWLVGFIVITSLINIVGVEVGSKINFVMVSIQVIIIIAFLIFTIKAITEGMGEGTLASFSPFYNPDVDFSYMVAGAAAACYCFLGFDALTTFTEDTIDPEKNIPRSIILTLLVCGGIFLIGTIAGQFAAGLSAQASGARLLYAMGRDGVLPKKLFGRLGKAQTPVNAILLTGIIALFAIFLDVTSATAYINFGGLIGFCFVNIAVISHYFIRKKERSAKGFFMYLVFPIIGTLFCLYLLVHLDRIAIILGCAWVVIGIIYLLVLTKGLKEEPPELGIDD